MQRCSSCRLLKSILKKFFLIRTAKILQQNPNIEKLLSDEFKPLEFQFLLIEKINTISIITISIIMIVYNVNLLNKSLNASFGHQYPLCILQRPQKPNKSGVFTPTYTASHQQNSTAIARVITPTPSQMIPRRLHSNYHTQSVGLYLYTPRFHVLRADSLISDIDTREKCR